MSTTPTISPPCSPPHKAQHLCYIITTTSNNMTSMVPLRPLKYQLPFLHIGDTTASLSVYSAPKEVFNLQDPIDVKKALYRLLDGQWGDIDGVCKRWTNGNREDVEKEFAVREEKLQGLKAMVLALRQVLDCRERLYV